MATRKKTTKKRSAAAGTKEPAFKVADIVNQFRNQAEEHIDLVKRMRTRVQPGAWIITARGETDK
jgi:hypothetical protein